MNYNANEIITCLSKTVLSSLQDLDDRDFEELGLDIADVLTMEGLSDDNWDYGYGVTKGVLIPTDADYVIKIPFTGTRKSTNETKYKKFSIFGFKDYCELEQFVYNTAMVNKLSNFLAKTVKIGEVGKFSIYVQEKAETNIGDWEDWTKKKRIAQTSKKIKKMISKKELKKVKKFCKKNKTDCFNAPFLALIEKTEGKEKVLKLCNFIEKYSNDVHISNLGFIKNRPVIIDYSGYYG